MLEFFFLYASFKGNLDSQNNLSFFLFFLTHILTQISKHKGIQFLLFIIDVFMGKTTTKNSLFYIERASHFFSLTFNFLLYKTTAQHCNRCPSCLLLVSNFHDFMKHDFPLERNIFPFFTGMVILTVLFCNLSKLLVTIVCDAVFDLSIFSGDQYVNCP